MIEKEMKVVCKNKDDRESTMIIFKKKLEWQKQQRILIKEIKILKTQHEKMKNSIQEEEWKKNRKV